MARFLSFLKKSDSAKPIGEERNSPEYKRKIELSTCALLLLMAKSDEKFTNDERQKIIDIMSITFKLDESSIDELIELSNSKINDQREIDDILTFMNKNFYFDEKYDLAKSLYYLMYADTYLSDFEVTMLAKIGKALSINKIALETIKRDVLSDIENGRALF